MDMPDKKTGAVVSALMVVAALAGVAVGLLWGNFGIKPPGEANALDDDAVVPAEAALPPDEVPPDVAARLAGLTRTRLTLIRSAIEDYALGNAGKPPATLRVVQGDQQSDEAVTWNQAQVKAIQDATEVCTLPLTGTVAGHDVSTTVAVVPGNVVYFVDAGASAFTDAVANILKYNAATILNTTPDQAYTAESGWGYTNPDSQVEAHEDYGTDIYSTIRNMTASSKENSGHGKPRVLLR